MEGLELALVAAHLLAAVFWVGGTLFLAFVGPSVRASGSAQASAFLRVAGLRFRVASWAAALVLVATGMLLLAKDGAFADFFGYVFARPALGVKLAAVAAMVAVKAVHDFVVGPRAYREARTAVGDPKELPQFRLAVALGVGNGLLGAAVIVLGVLVARGG